MPRRDHAPNLEDLRGLKQSRESDKANRWSGDVFHELWEAAEREQDRKEFRVPHYAQDRVTALVAQLRAGGLAVEHSEDNSRITVSWA